jgi:hypothetical protein
MLKAGILYPWFLQLIPKARVSVSDTVHAGFLILQVAGSLSAPTVVVHGGVWVEAPITMNGGPGGGYRSISWSTLD